MACVLLLDDVGVLKVLQPLEQRHLADYVGRDAVVGGRQRCLAAEVELLHGKEAPSLSHFPGFVHLAIGALANLSQQLIEKLICANLHHLGCGKVEQLEKIDMNVLIAVGC